MLVACGLAGRAAAQWVPDYQHYVVQRIGLFGDDHTEAGSGLQTSTVQLTTSHGFVAGSSTRYAGVSSTNGVNTWAYSPAMGGSVLTGLTGAANTGSAGYQFSFNRLQNTAGQVAGYSERITGENTGNGVDAWVWNGAATTQIGLRGGVHTGSGGFQVSELAFQNAAGQVAGYSERFTGVFDFNGRDSWGWDGTVTRQIGLHGTNYASSDGYQYSELLFQSASGHVVGQSLRLTPEGASNGHDSWVWNGATTTQVGLTGGANTGIAGVQYSAPMRQNAAGQVVGYSERYAGDGTGNGRDMWAYEGAATVQIGLIGAANTSDAGYRYSDLRDQNAAGHVVGYSQRFSAVTFDNGYDAWVWNGTTTTQLGFTGAGYTGSGGYQASFGAFQNDAGQITGSSDRIVGVRTQNGRDVWVWNGVTIAQVGLTGADYTGSAGYRASELWSQNETGQVVGYSYRFTGVETGNGQDAWVWNGSGTTRIGLIGAANTGSAGYRFSLPQYQHAGGVVTGTSNRYVGENTFNGQDAWAFNGTTTVQIGLTGAGHADSTGYQHSEVPSQSGSGSVVGYSYRYIGANPFDYNGLDAWVWNGVTTTQIGLTGGVHTGSAGYQSSAIQLYNSAGQVAGFSQRITGVDTVIGGNGRDTCRLHAVTKP
ncbi:MAG: hypothetical protein ACREJO_16260, partial [Phycisphaerales bacterium]